MTTNSIHSLTSPEIVERYLSFFVRVVIASCLEAL